jgi:hypothetical protein
MHKKVSSENLKGKDLEDISLGGRIILKWDLKK